MKIAIYLEKTNFTPEQLDKLSKFESVVFSSSGKELTEDDLIKHASSADILALDPDNFGGFEKAKSRVTKVAESLPHLKGITLTTTSFGWVDLGYFKKRNVPVCNVPGYSRESVAEHTLAMLLNMAKRIFVTDRRTQKGAYRIEMGFELRGKTLGIIGLGSIGTATAELAKGIGMKVIAYNRSQKTYPGAEMVSLNELLSRSHAIAIHITHEDNNHHLINENAISLLKPGVIIANTADREAVDEAAMANALKDGKVDSYAVEVEEMKNTPLANVENAFMLKGFGWHTKEALQNLFQIVVDNIESLIKGNPQNKIV